ncbi:hypothetical protein [Nocardioides sp.]|uniref:hypothetical protein n=1 Tax=Nocardioides sp. TaxID=35761 RepID=UPI002F401ADB
MAIRQDSVRWYREQRAALYVDLLVEADAEHQAIERDAARAEAMADAERFADEDPDRSGADPVAEHDALVALMPDTHLPPRERALLGARANGYASPTVVRLFRALQAEGGFHGVGKPAPLRRFEAGRAFDALEVQIQSELRRHAPWKERRAEHRPQP